MQSILSAIGYFAASQLLLTGLFFLVNYRHSRLGVLITLLCVCLLAAVWNPFAAAGYPVVGYVVGRIAAATPAVLWLFAHALFEDEKEISTLTWVFLIGYQVPRAFVAFPEQIFNFGELYVFSVLNPISLLVAFGLTLHVIFMSIRETGNDLLEERRRLRGPFAAGLGVIMALLVATLLLPIFLVGDSAVAFGQVAFIASRLVIFSFFLFFNLVTFRLTVGSQFIIDTTMLQPAEKSDSKLQLSSTDQAIMNELDRRMREEKLFAQPELTIGQLAETLSVQEYKLRLIINRELGYKNFNQFLNHYRIEQASELLKIKSKHRNIAIIAQDVGYGSLSTFNTAFKKLKGITPTEYKARHTASS